MLLQVTLFVGAVQRVWADEAAFHATMAQYGPMERCFLMHNPDGASKVPTLALLPHNVVAPEPCFIIVHCLP